MEGDPHNFRPPVLVNERVAWMGSGSGLPQSATVRWIGRIPEITTGWTVGIELDNAMPFGGIDGTWRKRQLFSCEPKHGLLVPIDKIMKQSSLMKTRHSIGEKFYDEGHRPIQLQKQDLIRKLSLPQSANSQEFISRVLPKSSNDDKKAHNDAPQVGLNFKVAASQLLKPQLLKQTSLDSKSAPLTVANVRTLEKINEQPDTIQTTRLQTFDELEKFKKHLDELVKFKNSGYGSRTRKKKLGKNPESLYELAKPIEESEKALFLRVIGEKKPEVETPILIESAKPKILDIKQVEDSFEPEFTASDFEAEKIEQVVAEQIEVEDLFHTVLPTTVQTYEAESLTPTPTIRKKRQKDLTTTTTAPIPSPRRKSQDVLEDTSSVLYEPAFLKAYESTERDMSDVRGTFRRIDEDELDKRAPPPARRLLTSSVSVPASSSRKGLFSFLRWFRKKPKDDLDLDAFNVPSITSSPLFTRSRLANAGSVDTLYSIATVSSFAFVSGAQYQSRIASDKKKKRRAPPPPRDISLPSTLENHTRQLHRRSVSESYKDRRSGAFAHVNGKRKAPPPPPPPTDTLYPSLTSVRDDNSTNRKKRPAPLPPENPPEEIKSESVVEETIVCNDTLRLERGVLKPNKTAAAQPTSDVPKSPVISPVSPRPWYKRKSLEKRRERPVTDWTPEMGLSRTPTDSPLKFNFFSRNEEKKKEEKRKSGLSWLANISELDREAAEICRKEQAHQQQLLDDGDAKFYEAEPEGPKRSSTRELISLFNAIGNVSAITVNPRPIESSRESENYQEHKPAISACCDKPEIKIATVVDTKDVVVDEPTGVGSKAQTLFEQRSRRHHSPSPTVSTIAEISEPSSSAATLNQYSEAIWICPRCTLENFIWKAQCDVCSSNKPNGRITMNERPKSEMEFEIDWERELEKYFPDKKLTEGETVASKLMLSKAGNVMIKTEQKQSDLDELRRKRLAFFMKSLGNDASTSLRDAAAKKSLDEAEKSKLKGMLKEMKDSLPKYEGVKNNLNAAGSKNETLPDVTAMKINSKGQNGATDGNYGAIRRKPAEALLVTTTTITEDILVRKKNNVKKTRRVGDGPFELMRARDLANIIETKTGISYPAHVYANYPPPKASDDSSSASSVSDLDTKREMARLATQLTRAAGVAEFKATLDPSDANTLAINRLLRRLESAIAAGRHDQAATLARELAGLKVNCSVTRQRPSLTPSPTFITAEMYVEDKLTHQGPIPMKLHRTMTLSDLKAKVQTDFQIPGHVQRWILGKQLATEDYRTLEDFGVTMEKCPIFLYLVAPEPEQDLAPAAAIQEPEAQDEKEEGATARISPKLGKGWYYNYEEDRYSFCDSDSEEESPKAAAVKIIKRTIEKQKSKSPPKANGEEIVLQPPQQSKPYSPKIQRPPLVTSVSLPDETKEALPTETKSEINQGAVPRPRSRSIFDLIKPQANDTLKKDLKVISVNAVKETIEKLTRRGEDLQKNGWKCEACTLLNATNRMFCSVCFAPRPAGYSEPVKSPIEDELRRLRRDQALDLFIDETTAVPKKTEKQTYLQLVNLDGDDVVSNTEPFDCPVCLVNYLPGDGVVLKECLHTFCRGCLVQTVETSQEAEVKCPFMDYNYSCECVLQQREIKALVPKEVFEQYLARSVAEAENRMGNAFHCKTPDCKGWCILEDNVNEFRCPVCKHVNCLTCQAIHEGINCKSYQEQLNTPGEGNSETKRTKSMLEEMVQKGDAMACPTCQVVLMKKWGCDWLRCSMCKTEICWVTRGPRWGPAGKGDTSAGCKCGVNGIKCHPKCNYCH